MHLKSFHTNKKIDKLKKTYKQMTINPLSAKFTKWSNTLKQFVGKLPTNCLSVFDHFSGLAFKRLKINSIFHFPNFLLFKLDCNAIIQPKR